MKVENTMSNDSPRSKLRAHVDATDTFLQIEKLVSSVSARIASNFRLNATDQEDLRQTGLTAAYAYLPNYKPEVGKEISAYLYQRVQGEMTDYASRLKMGGITGGVQTADLVSADTEAAQETEDGADDVIDDSGEVYESIIDQIPDNTLDTPEDDIFKQQVIEMLGQLSLKNRNILIRHYGLLGYTPKTFRELAHDYRTNLTKIHMRIRRALAELKTVMAAGGYGVLPAVADKQK